MTRLVTIVLALVAASDLLTAQGPPRRVKYDSYCGSEIPWLDDFEKAVTAAKEASKPIFWFVPTGYGSRMDRRQEVYWATMGGMFMDANLIAMINEHFVPLRKGFRPILGRGRGRPADKSLAQRFDLLHPTWVEPGIVLLSSEGEKLHVMDKLSSYNSPWMLARMKKLAAQHDALAAVRAWKPATRTGRIAEAHAALAAGRIAEAQKAFDHVVRTEKSPTEAVYFAGVCRHMLGKTSEGDQMWKNAAQRDDRWGWKAKLELERWGPFIRGFEHYVSYPARVLAADPLTGSGIPSAEADLPEMTSRAIEILLAMQRESGGWDDSIYDFGGVDGLPNVDVAVSALCAQALLEWRHVAPARIDAALAKAVEFLLEEKHTNPEDDDEYVWAHIYRIYFFDRLAQSDAQQKSKAQKKIKELVRILERTQGRTGAWAHEYPNPFVTAQVIHTLDVARKNGTNVKKAMLRTGTEALSKARAENGTYSYGMPRRGRARASRVESSAGRMPMCELALKIGGRSDDSRVGAALRASFEQQAHYERVRKYDDHAGRFGIGGFFFFWDLHTRAMTLQQYGGPEKAKWMAELRKIAFDIHEADGGWLDSHELGKSYGTAMGLLLMKMTSPVKE